MIRRQSRLLALATIALLSATPISAQSGGTGCPAPSAIEQNDQITIGQTWLPMRIGIEVAKASCRVNDFLANFFKRQPDPDKATLDDVVEAAKPNNNGGDAAYQAKLRNIPSPTKNPGWNPNPTTSIVVLPPNTSGGEPVLFQPNAPGGPTPTSVSEIQGNGTLLSAEGMKRGTFRGGKLNGIGEEIDPNGTWRGGTFQNGTNMGYVYEVRTVNGKTYIAAGSVVNGKLDGMIERVYADGSTQFEDWENGQLMQVGVRAPKGQAALAPQARYKPPVEVATEDAYKHTGPRTPIAPGTTFNPARTVGTRPPGGARHPWVAGIARAFPEVDAYRQGLPLGAMANVANQCSQLFEENWKYASSVNKDYTMDKWYNDMAGMVVEVFQMGPKFLQDWSGRNEQNNPRNIEPCFGGRRVAMGAMELARPNPQGPSNGEMRAKQILNQCRSEYEATGKKRTEEKVINDISVKKSLGRAWILDLFQKNESYYSANGYSNGIPGNGEYNKFQQCLNKAVLSSSSFW